MSKPAFVEVLDERLAAIEEHVAEGAGSLEKLRTTAHNLIGRMTVLDDLVNQVENVAKTQRDLVVAVGIMNDTIREIHDHWIKDSSEQRRNISEIRQRLTKIEAAE